jgi:hypothetical protein
MFKLPQTNQTSNKKTSFKLPVCKGCGKPGHTKFNCPQEAKATLKTTKPMNKIGRVGKETAKAVAKWKRTIKPDYNGLYTCYISGVKVPYLMAEHPYSKTRHPDLRTEQVFEPVSASINKLKGSLDIDDFLEKYPQYKVTVKKKYLQKGDLGS